MIGGNDSTPAGARTSSPEKSLGVTLRRLRLLAIALVVGLIVVVEGARLAFYPAFLSWQGIALVDGAIFLSGLLLVGAMFKVIGRMQARLEQQSRELMALHAAALDIYSELDLDAVLEKVVDQAKGLVESHYGALSVLDERQRITTFVTAGLSAGERARIGAPPEGHGLLGVVLREGQRLRLADLSRDPRSIGFPANHPPMQSLLAVPILCRSPFRGNLYLAGKRGGAEFSPDDEETLVRFATMAAIAIDHAHLHRRLNELAVTAERLGIAHEMHDGLAQVLAAVNAKAQAVREHLRAGRGEEAARQLDQLAAAAREVYASVRESITGLRGVVASPDWRLTATLEEYAVSWADQNGIACEVRLDPEVRLAPATELQLLRIVQEALANVRKHAAAQRAEVRLERRDGCVTLTVADDGVGFDPAGLGRSEMPRFGLATMRERAESIGGKLRVGAGVGGGTAVVVEVPRGPHGLDPGGGAEPVAE
jgi:signal transduction histidine kinase